MKKKCFFQNSDLSYFKEKWWNVIDNKFKISFLKKEYCLLYTKCVFVIIHLIKQCTTVNKHETSIKNIEKYKYIVKNILKLREKH